MLMHTRLRRSVVALLGSALAAGALAAAPAANAADGTVSGTVTAPGGGGVSNVDVELYTLDPVNGWDFYDSVTTGAGGTYSLSTPSGSYRVGFFPSTSAYAHEYYDNATTVETATTIAVPGAGGVVVNAELAPPGSITGNVTGPAGTAGAVGVLLMGSRPGFDQGFYWPDWEILTYVPADASGNYAIPGVPAGSYRIGFVPANPGVPGATAIEWYDDQVSLYAAKDVAVAAGQNTAGINATVAAGAAITGTVTDSAGAPQTSTMVTALTKVGKEWKPAFSGMTASDGTYAIYGLAASTYRVRFDSYLEGASTATTEYWQDKGLLSNATGVPLVAGQTAGGIDAKIVPGEHAAERKRVVQNTAVPAIAGTPVVGGTLTASAGTWTPTPTSYAFQWMRDDQPIVGAVGATYVPTEADLGTRLTVMVTASEDDVDSASARSVATAPVERSAAMVTAGLKQVLKGVKLKGKAKVGTTVKLKGLDASFRAPVTTKVRYRIQWYAGAKKIKKATKTRLRLTPAVRGKKISVKVTAVAGATRVSKKLILGKAR